MSLTCRGSCRPNPEEAVSPNLSITMLYIYLFSTGRHIYLLQETGRHKVRNDRDVIRGTSKLITRKVWFQVTWALATMISPAVPASLDDICSLRQGLGKRLLLPEPFCHFHVLQLLHILRSTRRSAGQGPLHYHLICTDDAVIYQVQRITSERYSHIKISFIAQAALLESWSENGMQHRTISTSSVFLLW